MALDGITIAALVNELKNTLVNGRITKIAQPEKDELLLTIKQSINNGDGSTMRFQKRLTASVNPSLPLLYLNDENKQSPMSAPTFCMVLRKHLNNCRITEINQAGLERVIRIELEHLNEMGDLCRKFLIIELMGKHSNIIFCDENNKIIDSIKHISLLISSVREVLPGRDYFIPDTQNKYDPFTITEKEFTDIVLSKPVNIAKALYTSLTGFSPVLSNELIYISSLSGKNNTAELSDMEKLHLYRNFTIIMDKARNAEFEPCIIYKGDEPIEFSCIPLSMYSDDSQYSIQKCENTSQMLCSYYSAKEVVSRIRQKSYDLRKITNNALERARKKYDLQAKQLKDTGKRDKYKVYGELLTTYGYELKGGEKSFTCDNYYTNEKITMSAVDNAKRFFEKYSKLKRTFEALNIQIEETKQEILHLESISNALDIARHEEDLATIRKELSEYGYMKRQTGQQGKGSKKTAKSKPLHYISSHVIVKTEGKELPDRTFEEAARLAAYYSKAKEQGKAEIDYIQKKHVKKPNGSKPGFVVYYTNYSMTIDTDISGIKEVLE